MVESDLERYGNAITKMGVIAGSGAYKAEMENFNFILKSEKPMALKKLELATMCADAGTPFYKFRYVFSNLATSLRSAPSIDMSNGAGLDPAKVQRLVEEILTLREQTVPDIARKQYTVTVEPKRIVDAQFLRITITQQQNEGQRQRS